MRVYSKGKKLLEYLTMKIVFLQSRNFSNNLTIKLYLYTEAHTKTILHPI